MIAARTHFTVGSRADACGRRLARCETSTWKTQWRAMLLALSGFVIPFSFAYDPALLLITMPSVAVAVR